MVSFEKREKREVLFIVLSVLLVAVVGLVLTKTVEHKTSSGALVGQAVTLDSDYPTDIGMFYVLENLCFIEEYDGVTSCDAICDSYGAYCLPLEQNCDEVSTFDCSCCTYEE